MKQSIRKILNATGFDIVKIKNQHGSFEQHLKQIFLYKNIECVIDVGANSGQYGKFLRSLGFNGWIVSFEPVKLVYDKLVEAAKGDDKWLCYHLALGDKNETKVLNVYSSTVFSSFLEANEYSKKIWNSLENVTHQEVSVARLDDIFPEIYEKTACNNYYLKLDTQGYDLNVFHGGLASLTKVNALQTELSLIHVYKNMISPYEILNEFHAHDYFISGMYPINRDKSLAVIEYDCVLVKRTTAK